MAEHHEIRAALRARGVPVTDDEGPAGHFFIDHGEHVQQIHVYDLAGVTDIEELADRLHKMVYPDGE